MSLKTGGALIPTMVSMSDLLILESWKTRRDQIHVHKCGATTAAAAAAAAAGRAHVHSDIYDLPHTHTQTNNKSQSFSSDIQIKTKRPSGGRFIGVLCAYDSFITGAMKCRPGQGGIIVCPPTISNHSLV